MTEKAKVVTSGASQIIELPNSCRFPDDQREVIVRREGNRVILEPPPSAGWTERFLATLGAWDGEIERPPQTPITHSKNPFD
ncbi:MAG TPA: hypothetical protein VEU30_15080 [Thermoanaerobaculia bacterium]|nr:hypothetical protein [Thermoanaerobaculia bacterium]